MRKIETFEMEIEKIWNFVLFDKIIVFVDVYVDIDQGLFFHLNFSLPPM